MARKLSLPVLLLLSISSSIAVQWWEKQPYLEWTESNIEYLLNESPWVALSPLALPRSVLPRGDPKLPARVRRPDDPAFPLSWRILLLSARPIREAYLRKLSLAHDVLAGPDFEKTIPVDEVGISGPEASRARLRRFMESHPHDIRVGGDDRHVVIAVAVTQFRPPSQPTAMGDSPSSRALWPEDPRPEGLVGLDLEDLKGKTFLSTGSGNRVAVIQYDPPGMDMLGAKLYFPRTLPDGKPFITAKDTELRFETQIGDQKIKAKFDLRKLIYAGKLEI